MTLSPSNQLRRHAAAAEEALTFEPSERRVRALIGSVTVVDSYAPVLIWEPQRPVPAYVFAKDDVRVDLLRPSEHIPQSRHQQVRRWYDLVLDGHVYPGLVYEYDADELDGYLGVDWFGRTAPGVEHWFEEDEEIFKHPRDPYKRVDALVSSRHVQVLLDGVKLADTHRPVLLFETRLPTRYYIPPDDVDFTYLSQTELSTTCPYKGDARYWSATVNGNTHMDIVWSYPTPLAAVPAIRGHLAFYNELVDTVVDGVSVPRPLTRFRAPTS